MRGMDILINGRKRKFLPVTTKSAASFVIQWLITELPEDYISVCGMQVTLDGSRKNPFVWESDRLKAGDEITVRLTSTQSVRRRSRRQKA